MVPAGVCHFCMAGIDGYPYTDMSAQPAFLRTMTGAAALCPWLEISPFTAKLPSYGDMPQMIYRPDIWHNWHLGHGRYFISSALVCLLGLFANAGLGVVPRLQAMTRLWISYCRRVQKRPYLTKFSKENLGFMTSMDWPEGNWQKASTTTLLMEAWHEWFSMLTFEAQEWMEEWLQSADFADRVAADEIYVLILLVVKRVNALFRCLYRKGAWLNQNTARAAAGLGLESLRAYERLATIHVMKRLPRFPLHPKSHMLYHIFKFMEDSAEKNEWTESPLVDGCQQDEAFVGILSRFSRRVAPRSTIDRTYDLYTVSLREHWLGEK